MILLDDFLPRRGVAGHTATDKRIYGLVVVQSTLPQGHDSWPKSRSLPIGIYDSNGSSSSMDSRPGTKSRPRLTPSCFALAQAKPAIRTIPPKL